MSTATQRKADAVEFEWSFEIHNLHFTVTQLHGYVTDISIITTTQRKELHLQLIQYRNAVVGAESDIRALQLTATQVQWS